MKKAIKKSSVRDTWIPETWRYNGAGYQKNKKKVLPRKQKYKGLDYQPCVFVASCCGL